MREVGREITQSSDTTTLHNHLCGHVSHAQTSASLCYTLPLLYSTLLCIPSFTVSPFLPPSFLHSLPPSHPPSYPHTLPLSLSLSLSQSVSQSVNQSLTHSHTHSFSQIKKYKHKHKDTCTHVRTYASTKNTHLSSSLR